MGAFRRAILKGRLKGDREGKLTYIGPRGSSVLYFIIFKEDDGRMLPIARPIELIEVLRRTGSDHLPVTITFKAELEEGSDSKGKTKQKNTEEPLVWNKELSERYKELMEEL